MISVAILWNSESVFLYAVSLDSKMAVGRLEAIKFHSLQLKATNYHSRSHSKQLITIREGN